MCFVHEDNQNHDLPHKQKKLKKERKKNNSNCFKIKYFTSERKSLRKFKISG